MFRLDSVPVNTRLSLPDKSQPLREVPSESSALSEQAERSTIIDYTFDGYVKKNVTVMLADGSKMKENSCE